MFKLNLANISDETRKSHAPVNQGSLKVCLTRVISISLQDIVPIAPKDIVELTFYRLSFSHFARFLLLAAPQVVFTLPDNTEHIATEEFRLDLPVSYLKAYLDRVMLFNQSVIDVASSGKVLDDVLSLVDVGFVGGQVAQIEVRRAQDADAYVTTR